MVVGLGPTFDRQQDCFKVCVVCVLSCNVAGLFEQSAGLQRLPHALLQLLSVSCVRLL